MCGTCGGEGQGQGKSQQKPSGFCAQSPQPQAYCSCPLPVSCTDVLEQYGSPPCVWPCDPTITEPEPNCRQRKFVPFPTCDCGPPPSCCFNVPICTPRCPTNNGNGNGFF